MTFIRSESLRAKLGVLPGTMTKTYHLTGNSTRKWDSALKIFSDKFEKLFNQFKQANIGKYEKITANPLEFYCNMKAIAEIKASGVLPNSLLRDIKMTIKELANGPLKGLGVLKLEHEIKRGEEMICVTWKIAPIKDWDLYETLFGEEDKATVGYGIDRVIRAII